VTDSRHLLQITCGGCDATWAGADRAHCGACHETWESVELYDLHRQRGTCRRPQDLDVVPTKNRIWQRPSG
jgi:hypothetical protein